MLTLKYQKMKNFAKLMLYFSLTFALLFLLAVLLVYLTSWLSMLRSVSVAVALDNAAEVTWKALPGVLYFTILLALSYTARRKIAAPFAVIGIFIMSSLFAAGISLGISRAEALGPVFRPASVRYAEPGLIFSRSDIDIVLLGENSDIYGPRLVSIANRPFIYQEQPLGPNNTLLSLPDLPFGDEPPWFFQSIGLDFSLSARELRSRFEDSLISFAIYAFALILFLSSLRFLLELTQWPLANLFIGALVFRLILSLESFLNTREINALLASFLDGRFPSTYITPVIFCALSALTILYTFLAFVARPRRKIDG